MSHLSLTHRVLPGLVDVHGGFLPSGLTSENIRSWLPESPTAEILTAEEDSDASSDEPPTE